MSFDKLCVLIIFLAADHRAKWRVEGSKAQKAMDNVSEELIPFIVTWLQKSEFKTANAGQEETLQALVARRAVKVQYSYFQILKINNFFPGSCLRFR